MNNSFTLTKQDLAEYLNCPTLFWMEEHHPEMFPRGELTAQEKEGIEVGRVAEGLFPGCVRVKYSTSKTVMVDSTKQFLKNGTRVIAEAAFSTDKLHCRVDLLEVCDDGYVINEVKSVNSVRSKKGVLENEYLIDCAFQYYVLKKCGFNVKKVNLIHTDSTYRRQGALDLSKLFVIDDVTKEIKAYADGTGDGHIDHDIASAIACYNQADSPDAVINSKCKSAKEECPLWKTCAKDITSPNVFELANVRGSTKDKLFGKGFVSFNQLLSSGELKQKPKEQVESELYDTEFLRPDPIRQFLDTLWYPLCFFDFESYQKAVPEYDNQWPWEQVTFQYSLDILKTPDSELEHYEFLGDEHHDPRRELAEQMIKEIPQDACVTAYHQDFEATRIKELADIFPDISAELMQIHDNIRDFEIPFKDHSYYIKDMQGRSSIKFVLPALYPNDPSLNYHHLPGVQNGGEASAMFVALRNMQASERDKQRAYMLRYCGLDTFAMVKVWQALLEKVDQATYNTVTPAIDRYVAKRDARYQQEDQVL